MLIYETGISGVNVKVYTDRVEYKGGPLDGVNSIPVAQIASVRADGAADAITIETTSGREYVLGTGTKQDEVRDAIYQAMAGRTAARREAPMLERRDHLRRPSSMAKIVLIMIVILLAVMAVLGLAGAAWFVMSAIGTPGISRAIGDAVFPMLIGTMALGSIAIVIAVTINRRDPG